MSVAKHRGRLLILNGGISEVPLIAKAKDIGFSVITTGNDPNLPGHAMADEYVPADYSDKDAILDLAITCKINRIVSCANDFGVITASYVAEKLGWPGHDTYEHALVLHQKDLMKDFFFEIGIPSPRSYPCSHLEQAIDYLKQVKYPVIVKASDLTGGKGVRRADNAIEAESAIRNAFERSRKKSIVIEPYLSGIQQSIVTFVMNGKVIASSSNDTYQPINPYLIQSETLPAIGIEQIRDELHAIVEKICHELNLVDGMFTLQYIIVDGKPYVIEVMRRCLGNQYLTVAGIVTGFPWEEALIRAEAGLDLTGLTTTTPRAAFAGHHGVMADREGIVVRYDIDPRIESHVFKKIDVLSAGDEISDHMNERIAYLYYIYDDHDEMTRDVSHMNDLVHVVLEDDRRQR